MRTVGEIVAWLERFAPIRLAEPWDNVGLLWGSPAVPVSKVMTCLTVTPTTAAEAIAEGAGLIVSHHPVLFKPIQRLSPEGPSGFLWDLARANVAVCSPHTAFDNGPGGINELLAEKLGLIEVTALRPAPVERAFKVVVFTPEADCETVLDAAFEAGAGRIGDYRECSFGTPGTGTFFGEETAHPAVGQRGRRERVAELRLEVLCPEPRLAAVLRAIRQVHSYEEPAIDIYPLHVEPRGPGIGRVGRLPAPERLESLAARVGRILRSETVQCAGDPQRSIERVAIACGAGDDFVREVPARADVLLTGEARYHRALEAEQLGISLIVAGHHATERVGVEALAERISRAFSDLSVWPSGHERDPWRPVSCS